MPGDEDGGSSSWSGWVEQVVGDVGDVVLLHPWTVHSGAARPPPSPPPPRPRCFARYAAIQSDSSNAGQTPGPPPCRTTRRRLPPPNGGSSVPARVEPPHVYTAVYIPDMQTVGHPWWRRFGGVTMAAPWRRVRAGTTNLSGKPRLLMNGMARYEPRPPSGPLVLLCRIA